MWDYPRPPALEPTSRAPRRRARRRDDRRHPRAVPRARDQSPTELLRPARRRARGRRSSRAARAARSASGRAARTTSHVHGGDRVEPDAAWGYDTPARAFAPIRGYVAFYAGSMDACFVDDERVDRAGRWLLRRLDHREHRRAVQGRSRNARLVSGVSVPTQPVLPGLNPARPARRDRMVRPARSGARRR